ncbi:hypothetical protein E2C01_048486 [Portunus trituberculatus]|uniref:Uncharacterized protein n=1 Tax=Portunus trituberculatus TaxID=210409 RepID=A0A5B7GDI6_PORTR|nr:hypothetical protein [Portunus trituberculatus]
MGHAGRPLLPTHAIRMTLTVPFSVSPTSAVSLSLSPFPPPFSSSYLSSHAPRPSTPSIPPPPGCPSHPEPQVRVTRGASRPRPQAAEGRRHPPTDTIDTTPPPYRDAAYTITLTHPHTSPCLPPHRSYLPSSDPPPTPPSIYYRESSGRAGVPLPGGVHGYGPTRLKGVQAGWMALSFPRE